MIACACTRKDIQFKAVKYKTCFGPYNKLTAGCSLPPVLLSTGTQDRRAPYTCDTDVFSAIRLNMNEEVASFYYSCSLCKVPDLIVGEDECHCLCASVCICVRVCKWSHELALRCF